ncbi:hypothetical protein KJ682_13015 [bacterium]|nr:hypothetical protein [bacterium]
MSDQLDFLDLIVSRLDDAGIPYMLTGSVAMSIYAEPRMTRDIDLVVECGGTSASQWVSLFSTDCYISEDAVRDALERTGMFNIIHLESVAKADFIIRSPAEYRQVEFRRRIGKRIGNRDIQVVAPEDLFLSKLIWWMEGGSEIQRRDLKLLLDTAHPLDLDYIEAWAGKLGARDKLKEIMT